MSWCVVAGPRVCNSISYLAMNSKTVRVVAFGVEQSKLRTELPVMPYTLYTTPYIHFSRFRAKCVPNGIARITYFSFL